jgi:hypothetical protein
MTADKIPQIQDLMAPTWHERVRADSAIFESYTNSYPNLSLPSEILNQIPKLSPSPEAFLGSMIEFWADFLARKYKTDQRPKEWASSSTPCHPLQDTLPQDSTLFFTGFGFCELLKQLGKVGNALESQIAGLHSHPELIVSIAAEHAITQLDTINDSTFNKILAAAKERSGMMRDLRYISVAKHTDQKRLNQLLESIPKLKKENAFDASLYVLSHLKFDLAQQAQGYLINRLENPWSPSQLTSIYYSLGSLAKSIGQPTEVIESAKKNIYHEDYSLKCASAYIIASSSPVSESSTLSKLVSQENGPSISSICCGLSEHTQTPTSLLRLISEKALGNYDEHDQQPHYSAMELLLSHPSSIEAMPELLSWWERATQSDDFLEPHEIDKVIDFIDIHGTQCKPLLAGLERSLKRLNAPAAAIEEISLPEMIDEAVSCLDYAQEHNIGDSHEIETTRDQITQFNEELKKLQEEINASTEAYQNELLTFFPETADELSAQSSFFNNSLQPIDLEENTVDEEEDERVTRLRKTIILLTQ